MGGVACACQKIECEEETVTRILSNMNLAEIETKCAYSEFNKCINNDDGYLDYFLFKNYLSKIVGENNYKNAQNWFFENLRKLDENNKNIKKIGALIIYLSKGNKNQKIEMLFQHFLNNYKDFNEKTVKDFINDLIDCHTENCINSFREFLDLETVQLLSEFYKKSRKRKLMLHIYVNYERLKMKHIQSPKFNLNNEKLNNSVDVDYVDDNLIDPVNKSNDLDKDYERNNKNQCDDFLKKTFTLDMRFNDEEKVLREFIELTFNHLSGEYMRNWLYEDYMKEKSFDSLCI